MNTDDVLVETGPDRHPAPRATTPLLLAVVAGTGAAVVAGVYATVHEPTGVAVNLAGFSTGLAAKSWLTTLVVVLAVAQVVTGAGMWGRLGLGDRSWVPPVHRWTGRLAVLGAAPVAAHCLYALGADSSSPRTLAHSVFGCLFLGVFVTKMLGLRVHGLPGWAIPALGGLLFTTLAGLWLTSALWFFTTFGVTR